MSVIPHTLPAHVAPSTISSPAAHTSCGTPPSGFRAPGQLLTKEHNAGAPPAAGSSAASAQHVAMSAETQCVPAHVASASIAPRPAASHICCGVLPQAQSPSPQCQLQPLASAHLVLTSSQQVRASLATQWLSAHRPSGISAPMPAASHVASIIAPPPRGLEHNAGSRGVLQHLFRSLSWHTARLHMAWVKALLPASTHAWSSFHLLVHRACPEAPHVSMQVNAYAPRLWMQASSASL